MPSLEDSCLEYLGKHDTDAVDCSHNIDVNLSKLKIEVIDGTWIRTGPEVWSQEEKARQPETVKRNNSRGEACGTLASLMNYKRQMEVVITSDIIKGMNRRLELPVDPKLGVGDFVYINVGKHTTRSEPVFPVYFRTGQLMGPGETETVAVVRRCARNYSAEFACDVELRGKVLFPSKTNKTEKKDFLGVCEAVQNTKPALLGGLVVDPESRKVTFRLQWEMTVREEYPTIQWQ